jgi:Transposase domain (DUF772)
MSLKPDPIQPVPEETARIAKAAFRKGNPLLKLRDELGSIFSDADFADLFPKLGQPGLAPWRLALITLLQFRENLPDRQAAEAVRARIDWKYLLGLELPASTTRCCASSARACWRAAPRSASCTSCWTCARPAVCSRPAAHRRHARAGVHSRAQPPRAVGRDLACRAQ